jgi:hypothetical protein
MNIHDSLDQLLPAMTQIECAGKNHDEISPGGPGFLKEGLLRAREELLDYQMRIEQDSSLELDEKAEKVSARGDTNITLSSLDGHNNYAIRGDGTIELSRHTALEPAINMAMSINFSTY